MPAQPDLYGQRFGKLVAVERAPSGLWRCECDCGETLLADPERLIRGKVTGCGCGKPWFSRPAFGEL